MLKSARSVIVWLCVLISFMSLFVSVGYAKLTTHLTISGTTEYNEPALVFITDVAVKSSSNVTGTPTVMKVGFLFMQHSDFTLQRQQGNRAGSIMLEVTVKNNSGVEQYFAGYSTEPALPEKAVVTYANIKLGDPISNGQTKTFQITIQNTNTDWNGNISFKDREGILKFSPNYDDSFTEEALNNITAIFSSVLAGTGIDGQGTGIYDQGTYIPGDQILSHIKSEYMGNDGGGTGGYTGNVGDASQEVKDLMYSIFGDNMLMQIGNQYYSVSFLIKNQRINHNNDMVLYFTPDPLLLGGGSYNGRTDRETANCYRDLNMVPVYALVFTYENGAYESLTGENGESFVFSGEAPVCDMEGAMGAENTGNFNTNIWNSLDYPDLWDESGGSISSYGNNRNGELDEAYKKYIGGEKPVTSN